jgi:hypothetical protein
VALTRIVVATLLMSTLLVLPRSSSDAEAVEPGLFEGFEGVAVGSDPVGWVDTAARNSMVVDDSLFEVMAVDGSQALGTVSTASNIHSHHVGGAWGSAGGYTYSGRMRMSDQSAGIGVTVFSDYNQSDSYYRLRRFNSNGAFELSPHGTSMSGGVTNSGVVPVANVWYQFKVEAVDTGSRTEIRAKVWQQGTAEPAGWQIDAYDGSSTRRTAGTVGVWSHTKGSKFWDDLTVQALAAPGPHALTVSSSGSGSVVVNPVLAEYAHGSSVTLTATPAAGWKFAGWSGDLTGSQNPATVVIEADTVIQAVFVEQIEVVLTTSTVGSGSVTVNPVKAKYLAGDSVTLTATPDSGWEFVGWSGGLTGSQNPATVTLNANTTITATFEQIPGAGLVETFEGVAVGSDPVGWVDTAARNSMVVDDSLFKVMAVDGSQALGTVSTASNIHSHHVGGAWGSAGGYTYSGRMRMSDQSAGIGVTLFSDYNQSDSYYRLRRFNSNGAFELSPHGTSMSGGVTNSGVVPVANAWYQFKVEAVDTGSRTEIRAKVWQQGTAEPAGWQIDAYDGSSTRRTAGTVGVWSHTKGSKFWDDLTVQALAAPGPHALTVSSSGSGSVVVNPVLAEYAHGSSVTLTATPAAGWKFAGWSGDLTGSQNPATVVIEADTVIQAVFVEQIEVVLTTSTVGSGSVTVNPVKAKYLAGDSVTLTAAPDSGWEFVGWSGGLTGSQNPATVTLNANTTITATFSSATSQPRLDVWYGDRQVYGALGITQPYYNVLGNVSDPDGVASLSYSLNGGAARALSIGPDSRRLAQPGDFNIDVAFADLRSGLNDVVVTATDAKGNKATKTVQIQRLDGNVWPSPYTIDWDAGGAINDVAQVVDGKWALAPGGVRAVEPGYDRLVSLGDVNWTDYEVTFPVTINALDASGFDRWQSGGAGLGLLMRWNGHTDQPIANWQPKTGWLPYGAIGWYWWTSPTAATFKLEGNNRLLGSANISPVIGSTIMYKMRVETQPDGRHLYRLKTWLSGRAEPTAWTVSGYGQSTDPDNGSLMLLAHHVDATFGDVTVTPLGQSTGSLDVRTVGSGSVTVDPVKQTYAFGDRVTLTATPNVGQVFAGWSGDISGLANPVELIMDSSKTVTATFVDGSADPVVSGVSVQRFVNSAVVSWSTDKPTTGSVVWGTSSAYGSGPVVSSTAATSHSVTLSGLDPATVYRYQITATDTSGNSVVTPEATFTTLALNASALTSDDFNACAVDGSVWTFVDPVGDGSVSVNGTQLELSVPAGIAHDVWSGGNMAPRLMQPVGNVDFEAEIKFESPVADRYEMQGLIVQQDLDDFLRFDFYGDGGQTRVFAARFVAGVPTALANVAIPVSAAPLYLKVTRTGDTWVLAYSTDGSTWTSVTSFVHALSVSEVGPFVGNAGSSPPGHTAVIDYVFDTSAPIVPEDPNALTCVDGSADPVVSGVSVQRFVNSAVVSWSTDKPTTGSVVWGTSSAYGSGPVVSSTAATSHSVTLSGLDPATVYRYQITATDTSGNSVVTPDATFTTLAVSSSALVSDDFNACAVDGSVWTFVDPVGDGSVSVNGTQLELSVPAGIAHDVWSGGNMAPRLMQPVGNLDFEAEVKFESLVKDRFELQGLIVQQDLDDFLRFDFHGDGTQTRVFAARFVAGVPTALANVAIPASTAPLHLKVTRTGNTWVLAHSRDGSTWTSVTSFVHALSVSEAGPFVGNAGSSPPAHTAVIDYVFDTSAPIVPEDADTITCG